MPSKVIDIDRGHKRMLAKLRRAGGHVVAGVPASADAPKEGAPQTTLVQVALAHEVGTKRIPRRSFIADTVDRERGTYARIGARKAVDVLLGRMSQRQLLDLVGHQMVGDMKQRIRDGIAPALAESTIARKGSSTPLIDTGQLRNSITHEVRGA